jgi:hypothetical protein
MKQLAQVWAMVAVMILAAVTLTGCMGAPGKTSKDVERDHRRYIHENTLMMQEDFDSIWMIDRPSRLTSYTIR